MGLVFRIHAIQIIFVSNFGLVLADPITQDDRLTVVNQTGLWHRKQRGNVNLEQSCAFSSLHNGCLSASRIDDEAEKHNLLLLFRYLDGWNWVSHENWEVYVTDEYNEAGEKVGETYRSYTSPCWDHWYGITCNEFSRVIEIYLPDNRLSGDLESDTTSGILNQFEFLQKLNLGTTRAYFHDLKNENENVITGAFPSLKDCKNLLEVEISGNMFTSLNQMYLNGGSLLTLSAARNELETLPSNLDQFVELETLDLAHNKIDEAIPSEFGKNLARIRFVDLSYNMLSGGFDPISHGLADMKKVQAFSVSHNPKLVGEMPYIIKDEWEENDFISIMNTTMRGPIASLCLDIPFCYRFQYNTHGDLTWTTVLPDEVAATILLAQAGAQAASNEDEDEDRL